MLSASILEGGQVVRTFKDKRFIVIYPLSVYVYTFSDLVAFFVLSLYLKRVFGKKWSGPVFDPVSASPANAMYQCPD